MFIIVGSALQIFPICATFFVGSLCIWLIAKLGLKSQAGYSKFLEIIGLSEWIAVVGTIVAIILMNLMNSIIATPSGGLLLGDSFDMMNKGHKLLAALNVFTMWQVGVSGIGVAKVTGKSAGTGLLVSYGLWVFWVLLTTMLF